MHPYATALIVAFLVVSILVGSIALLQRSLKIDWLLMAGATAAVCALGAWLGYELGATKAINDDGVLRMVPGENPKLSSLYGGLVGAVVGFLLMLFVQVVTGGGQRVIGGIVHGKEAKKHGWYSD